LLPQLLSFGKINYSAEHSAGSLKALAQKKPNAFKALNSFKKRDFKVALNEKPLLALARGGCQ